MGLLDFLRRKKAKSTLSNNPYATKYRIDDIGLDNVIYLLYCDYEEANRWIKDAKKPNIYFSNFDKAVQILEVLDSYRFKYKFDNPTPAVQLQTLQAAYEGYTKNFIINYWNQTIKAANNLKTASGKRNRIQNFFEDIGNYSERLPQELLYFIESLKDRNEPLDSERKNVIHCGKYNICTMEDISKIPNTDIEAIKTLQKAATDFKRNGQMDLAIECLRKSNTIYDVNDCYGNLTTNQYLRIIKYLEAGGHKDEASLELESIHKKHPEFWDKRISNLSGIQETIEKNKNWKNDLVIVYTNNTCPICKCYNNKIYSISGKTKHYPLLPPEITNLGGFCPECSLGLNSYFEGINTPSDK